MVTLNGFPTDLQVWMNTQTFPPPRAEEAFSEESTNPTNIEESHHLNAGWLTRIRTEVFEEEQIEDLYVTIGDDSTVDYWIVIEHRDLPLVRRIIERQHESILKLFTKTENPPFQLDFHICYREGRDAREIVPDRAIRLER